MVVKKVAGTAENVKDRFFEPRVDKIRLSQRSGVVGILCSRSRAGFFLLSILPRYKAQGTGITAIQPSYKVLRDCVEVPHGPRRALGDKIT